MIRVKIEYEIRTEDSSFLSEKSDNNSTYVDLFSRIPTVASVLCCEINKEFSFCSSESVLFSLCVNLNSNE